ncbi:CBS domain-containing protein [Priestia megaterium]|uniref:CBS domain-containing protein n=1 Tax=Priestia megaterium TaxID=1404 RepID=UPI0011A1345D|nr:CBS domain-containing protein [Priestia megaterium]
MTNSKKSSLLLSERFEVSFNMIHEALKKIVKIRDDRFTVLLKVGASNHHIINTYKDDLEQYAKLRNAMVHEKVEIGYYIAEPNIKVVEHIEKIASILIRPNYALSIATKEVIFYNANDSIIDVIDGIRHYGYSQYPIYANKSAIGLLNSGDILKWMTTNGINNFFDLRSIKISDVLHIGKQVPLIFTSKDMNVFEIEDLFENAHKNKRDLGAVIVTENGKEDEKPLGMITAWDLIEIDYTMD